MDSIWQTAAGVLAGAIVIILIFAAKRSLRTHIGHTCARGLTVEVEAKDPGQLEQMIRELILLRDEKILTARIRIKAAGRGEEFIHMAGILAGKYSGITIC